MWVSWNSGDSSVNLDWDNIFDNNYLQCFIGSDLVLRVFFSKKIYLFIKQHFI